MGGLGSTAKESETRMPFSTTIICLSGGCARHMYDPSMLARHAKRLQDSVLSGGYPSTVIRRRHHVVHRRLSGGSRFFPPTNKLCQISLCGFRVNLRRELAMIGGLGNTDKDLAYEIFGPILDEGQNVENRLDSTD